MKKLYVFLLFLIPFFIVCSEKVNESELMTLTFYAIRNDNNMLKKYPITDEGISSISSFLATAEITPIYSGTLQLNSSSNQPDSLQISSQNIQDTAIIPLNRLSAAIIATIANEIEECNLNNSSIPHLPITIHRHNKQWIQINITGIEGTKDSKGITLDKSTIIFGVGLFGIGIAAIIYLFWKR